MNGTEIEAPARPVTSPKGMRVFTILWLGQFVSAIGTGLGGFALGVWIFEQEKSTTQFAMMAVVGSLAMLVFSPIGGVLADRMDRRKLLIVADLGAGLTTLAMAILLFEGWLKPWHIYPILALMVGFTALQGPALLASISQLVPRDQLTRASGMTQTSRAVAQIIGPLAAGVLVGSIGYYGVIFIDCASFLFAIGTLLVVRFPSPLRKEDRPAEPEAPAAVKAAASPAPDGAPKPPSLLGDLSYGWTYLRRFPGLLAMLMLYAVTNFAMGMVQVLLTPLILSFATPVELGKVSSAAAAGLLLGGLTLTVWGGPKRRMWGIFISLFVQGSILFLGGVQPSIPLIALAAFMFMFMLPILTGCSQSILQTKVEEDVQGRVFAMAGILAAASVPLSALLAGPLADNVFEPAMLTGGALAGTVGQWLGTGPGRGMGLMFVLLGGFVLVTVSLALFNARLRRVESEIPDAPHAAAESGALAAESGA